MRRVLARSVLPSGELWAEDYLEGGACFMDWRMAARFRMSPDGRGLRSRPYPEAKPVSIRVVGHLARAVARSLRGAESLHATALACPAPGAWAVALLGDSGEGKSTLAARLMARGWRLLSDDALPVEVRGGEAFVRAGAAHLKLSPAALASLRRAGEGRGAGWEFDPNLDKWVRLLPPPGGRFRLKAALLLARGRGRCAARRFSGARAALVLKASFYNRVFRPEAVERRQLGLAAGLAQAAGVWRLAYPSGLHRLDGVARFLERRLEARESRPAAASRHRKGSNGRR